ncbi:MAG: AAA family ATPase, partial [Clostridia bacterium]|nr:AAA family ATPase [Clostridia bacterium]
MFRLTSKLLLSGDLGTDSILQNLAGIFSDWTHQSAEKPVLIRRIYDEIKRLLDLATTYGFNNNLWHDYLSFVLMTNENSFSLTCEGSGAGNGSVNHFAKADFKIFKQLFDFDFSAIEADLGIDCFSVLSAYSAIPKRAQMYYRNVSERVRALSTAIEQAADENGVFDIVTDYYKNCGVGMFGCNRAFRIREGRDGAVEFCAINDID